MSASNLVRLADIDHEAAQDFASAWGVMDFRVKLQPKITPLRSPMAALPVNDRFAPGC